MRYWIVVLSKDHALRGISGGFIQACHGKAVPLKRMKAGDYLLCYCHKETFEGNTGYQKFLGLGQITSGNVYQYQMSEEFHPFRIDVNFILPVPETSIHPLIQHLSFIKDKIHWGYQFRYGHLEINEADFDLIVKNFSSNLSQQITHERALNRLF